MLVITEPSVLMFTLGTVSSVGLKDITVVSVSSLADYESMLKEKGINVGSEEANSLLKEMAKENPEILN
mgnify:CR=1 FL=1